MPIFYRAGYKYQLEDPYTVVTGITQAASIEFVTLTPDGVLIIESGYTWDGPSGPIPDTDSAMRGSLVHDALYELMRIGGLDRKWRHAADHLLHDICREDGMHALAALAILEGVHFFGERFTEGFSEKKIRIVGK